MHRHAQRAAIVAVSALALTAACSHHSATSPQHCPRETPLPAGPNARADALAAAKKAIPSLYPGREHERYEVTAVYAAGTNGGGGFGGIPAGMCGPTIGARTWIVELHFPAYDKTSADLSQGQLFLSRFRRGWNVWFQYH